MVTDRSDVEDLRQRLVDTVFRGRNRPSVKELLRGSFSKAVDAVDVACSGTENQDVHNLELDDDIVW